MSKENRFNITGDFIIEIKDTEQKYKLIATHPNRTITWSSNYKSHETQTHQSSKIELAENVWLAYNFELSNTSKVDDDGQELKFELSYPMRKIIVGGNYAMKFNELDTDLTIKWNQKKEKENDDENYDEGVQADEEEEEFKSLSGQFQWKDLTEPSNENHQSVLFALKHPKFERDVTLTGIYFKDKITLSKLEIDIDYSNDEDRHANFGAEIKDLTEEMGHKNYSLHIKAVHVNTNLNLLYDASIGVLPNIYKTEAYATYSRSFLPNQELELIGFFDSDSREIKYYVSNFLKLKFSLITSKFNLIIFKI